ncbi:protein grainyhead-like isoform X5 [Portunus trituberculatus]|uniref:protein grainyhead-like isoform X5 n=1 Tax=Portunus trituberculatus TaxID=210409 RepID=UPI001E1CBBC6|nr:protein grainyhead-like isoform X5 [Portunus trituberculatus]
MNELGEEASEGPWRQPGEHPFSAVTTAMLNINSNEEQQHVTLLYDYYKTDGPLHYDYYRPDDGSGVGSPVMGGAVDSKMTNGVSEGVSGAAPVEGILFAGGTEGVKPEPEDLTRRAVSPADRGVLCDKRRPLLPPPPPQGDSPPSLDVATSLKDDLDHHVIKEELEHHSLKVESGDRPRSNHTLVIQAPLDSGEKMSAGTGSYLAGFSASSPQSNYDHVSPYLSPSPQPYSSSTSPAVRGSPAVYTTVTDNYYRDYYPSSETQYTLRQDYPTIDGGYLRPPYKTNGVSSTLTVDLPSPADSGISADAITPRDPPVLAQTFGYEEIVQQGSLMGSDIRAPAGASPNSQRPTRAWHDFGRHTEGDKIQIPKIVFSCFPRHTDDDKIHIPKLVNQYGFKYHLETPISTSQRREDDRITYINKGQFYGVTMEYIHDPEKPLKSGTVKSMVMLVFREEKTQEDEIKAWQFWHSRQHSVKQRILDVDTKNSVGLIGCIEEIAHNAIVVYWNPLEAGAKINVAIQCLSTDFSSQKGVKGLPLHIQIDTFEDPRDTATLVHRGYSQIKVFCDKGAERKTRDEERRAAKRRMAATTRKKYEDLYHPPCDRSEFYSMMDLTKPPVLFTPADDIEKMPMELHGFYGHDSDNGDQPRKELCGAGLPNGSMDSPMTDVFSHVSKRSRLTPPLTERLMLYVRQDGEDVYTPLHLVPPSIAGLRTAIEEKYKIPTQTIKNIYRKNKVGVMAKVDDEMLRHYCNEDVFLMEVQHRDGDSYDLTLIELTGVEH